MPGKLPIDRARARQDAARPYEKNKRTFGEDQADLARTAEQAAPPPPEETAEKDRDDA